MPRIPILNGCLEADLLYDLLPLSFDRILQIEVLILSLSDMLNKISSWDSNDGENQVSAVPESSVPMKQIFARSVGYPDGCNSKTILI